jgi:hypothetical protein
MPETGAEASPPIGIAPSTAVCSPLLSQQLPGQPEFALGIPRARREQREIPLGSYDEILELVD